MKKLLYTVALVVMGITASYAQKQEKLTAEQKADRAATVMQQKLSLTADQKQKVQLIELDRIKKNEEWRKLDEVAMKGKMDERKAFMKASKDKIDAILTVDQKKTMDASRAEMKGKMKDRKGGKGQRGPKPGAETPPPPPANNN